MKARITLESIWKKPALKFRKDLAKERYSKKDWQPELEVVARIPVWEHPRTRIRSRKERRLGRDFTYQPRAWSKEELGLDKTSLAVSLWIHYWKNYTSTLHINSFNFIYEIGYMCYYSLGHVSILLL